MPAIATGGNERSARLTSCSSARGGLKSCRGTFPGRPLWTSSPCLRASPTYPIRQRLSLPGEAALLMANDAEMYPLPGAKPSGKSALEQIDDRDLAEARLQILMEAEASPSRKRFRLLGRTAPPTRSS